MLTWTCGLADTVARKRGSGGSRGDIRRGRLTTNPPGRRAGSSSSVLPLRTCFSVRPRPGLPYVPPSRSVPFFGCRHATTTERRNVLDWASSDRERGRNGGASNSCHLITRPAGGRAHLKKRRETTPATVRLPREVPDRESEPSPAQDLRQSSASRTPGQQVSVCQ